MKTLLILRHAKSSWKDTEMPDHERLLNKRGKNEAPQVGKYLREQGLMPDLILSSTAKRAQATVNLVVKACSYEDKVEYRDDFYPGDPRAYITVLHTILEEHMRVMVVGHNPALEELLQTLTGRTETIPTAGLVQVSLPIQTWHELDYETRGELVALWQPVK
jgi:phosphohistidine phosphatase